MLEIIKRKKKNHEVGFLDRLLELNEGKHKLEFTNGN